MIGERAKEGYLIIENKFAPGPSLEQVRAAGIKGYVAGAGTKGTFESATKTCCHCNVIVVLNPDRSRPRNYCRKCDSYVCDSPECSFECIPFAKKLDDAEFAALHAILP